MFLLLMKENSRWLYAAVRALNQTVLTMWPTKPTPLAFLGTRRLALLH